MLSGDAGNGKTCAARALWSVWRVKHGQSNSEMWDAAELARLLVCGWMGRPGIITRNRMCSFDATPGEIQRIVQGCCVLVLDDLFTDRPNSEELKAIRAIINWRSLGRIDENGKEVFLPLVITTNLDEESMQAVDGRIASRVFRFPAIEFRGADRRART